MHKKGMLAPVIATGEDVSVEVCEVRCVCVLRRRSLRLGCHRGCACVSHGETIKGFLDLSSEKKPETQDFCVSYCFWRDVP